MAIPVLDKEDGSLGSKMVRALEEVGCFRLVNHGVDTKLMGEMKAVARELTDLPTEVKQRTVDPHNIHMGYAKPNVGRVYYEGFNIDDVASPGIIDRLCSQLDSSPYQNEVMNKYASELHDLTRFIGRKFMEGLGMEGDLFKNYTFQIKLNRYNFGPETVGFTGGLLHRDPGFLTLLQDDEIINGLEIADKTTGEMIPVDPIQGSFAVILGDVAEAWGNGRFSIARHRVQCNSPNIRVSVGYFVFLGPRDEKVEAPPQLVDSDHPRRYVPFNFEDYRNARYEKSMGSGEALQYFLTKTA